MDIDLTQLRSLMRAIEDFDITELEIEKGDERIVLRRGGAPVAQTVMASVMPPPPIPSDVAPAPAAAPAAPPAPAEDPNVAWVTSPFVGTFYRAPSPQADPFVREGDEITAGQTLCIVEAMKLMNEIEAEHHCTILEVVAENGKPVEYGDRLFKIRKKT